MPIQKRKRKIKSRPKKRTHQFTQAQVDRLGELLALGYGGEEEARIYFKGAALLELDRLQSIVADAEQTKSWRHLRGCYTQAMTLYVFASVLYEKFPEHVLMSDEAFDALAKWLRKNWDKLSHEFREWYAITTIDLKAGTGHKVQADNMIKWLVFVHTGEDMGNDNEPRKRARPIRRRPVKKLKRRPGNRRRKA